MPGSYVAKERSDILRLALQKLQSETSITSIAPGSVARALAEVLVDEISDFYSALDFNMSMGLVSTAQGRALDLIGSLYNVQRKDLSEVATINQSVGVFYFYLDAPIQDNITIPQGTRIYTDDESFVGDRFAYTTDAPVTIPAGRTRAYVSITPAFHDSVFAAGKHTLTQHDFDNNLVKCTNPKAIQAQEGFETDENYRARIIKQVRTTAGGTIQALRFAGLAINGVRDVKIRDAAYGLGSVEAVVVLENRGLAATALPDAIRQMDAIRPAGVRLLVKQPEYSALDAIATIVIRKDVTDINTSGTARRAELGILRYLNTLLPGDKLVYSKLIESVLSASDVIDDVNFMRLQVAGTEILRNNFQPSEDTQIVPGSIEVSVA